MLKHLLALAAVLCVAACYSVPCSTAAASASCPAGHAQMGCSLPPVFKGVSAPPKGELFPDVSSYQGAVDWPAVAAWQKSHGWLPGAVFKLGEYDLDPDALQNADGLRAAGMVAIGYVFVRPGLQASTVIGWARDAGIRVVILDEEIAGIQGIAGSITPALKAAGLTVADYHSQDNVEDTTADGLPCWDADYGPMIAPVCTTGPEVAWQDTSLASVPGISGLVDESVNFGLLQLAKPPKRKPNPAVKPKPTVRLGVVVGRFHRPKNRAGYLRPLGLGNGWWEYRPDRTAGKGALLVGRAHRRPKVLKGYRRVVGLGAGWWEDVR